MVQDWDAAAPSCANLWNVGDDEAAIAAVLKRIVLTPFGFTRPVLPWYCLIMAQSYLGIITHNGLESLVPETDGAEALLRSRGTEACHGAFFCCWAVLHREVARDLQRQLRAERYHEALMHLNAEAQSLGTLLPASEANDLFTQA